MLRQRLGLGAYVVNTVVGAARTSGPWRTPQTGNTTNPHTTGPPRTQRISLQRQPTQWSRCTPAPSIRTAAQVQQVISSGSPESLAFLGDGRLAERALPHAVRAVPEHVRSPRANLSTTRQASRRTHRSKGADGSWRAWIGPERFSDAAALLVEEAGEAEPPRHAQFVLASDSGRPDLWMCRPLCETISGVQTGFRRQLPQRRS